MKKIQRVPLADYPYDIVFSIGNACGCAWYLKRCKLRLCAGPLDWVRGAETLEERVAIIANRFPNWLSPDNLTPFESDGARFITTDKTCGIRFIHDFRCAMPFAEELALVQAKYARRQTRFFEKVDQAQHVLLVWFNCLVPPASEETHRRALAQLRRALGNQVDLLSIEHDATLAMGDAVAICLLKKRGFTEEDFLMFHPSGALGRGVLYHVSDLMITGDRIPVLNENTSFRNTIQFISDKKLGCAIMVDDTGVMTGILTDGDIRRTLLKYTNTTSLITKEVMTKNPKVIQATDLAAKALHIMEKHSITSLAVCDSSNKPVGLIHIHDLLKAGVA